MNKRILGVALLAGALVGGPAMAAQNVANTSQKGSLLIYPKIDVDPENSSDTLIEISNDQSTFINIECYYVNEMKGRVDFDFALSPKATASWDVLTGDGNIAAPQFPSSGSFTPGDPNRGELVCFATDGNSSNQLAFNHLTGTATIIETDDGDADQTLQAYRYNAWAFAARSATGLAADYTVQGTAGTLLLTGGGAGTYDACPAYNIATFMPGENRPGSGATLDSVYSIDNDFTMVSCNQDLRQDFVLHLTKLQFTVWNAFENSYTGSYVCVDSTDEVPLNPGDQPVGALLNSTNFTFPTLRTANARFQVAGVKSTQCAGSENAGLLGVLTSSVSLDGDKAEDAELGSTTQGAGVEAGFVMWDPASAVPQALKHHK